jgi:hypothetical protein
MIFPPEILKPEKMRPGFPTRWTPVYANRQPPRTANRHTNFYPAHKSIHEQLRETAPLNLASFDQQLAS